MNKLYLHILAACVTDLESASSVSKAIHEIEGERAVLIPINGELFDVLLSQYIYRKHGHLQFPISFDPIRKDE